jgi:hypothetical protein
MWEILSWNFWKNQAPHEHKWDSYDTVEDIWNKLIDDTLNQAIQEAEAQSWRTILWPEALNLTSYIDDDIREILQNVVNLPPEEEDYIESSQFKIALFKQKLEEGKFRERLIEALKEE